MDHADPIPVRMCRKRTEDQWHQSGIGFDADRMGLWGVSQTEQALPVVGPYIQGDVRLKVEHRIAPQASSSRDVSPHGTSGDEVAGAVVVRVDLDWNGASWNPDRGGVPSAVTQEQQHVGKRCTKAHAPQV
jgi:hypothetical protein